MKALTKAQQELVHRAENRIMVSQEGQRARELRSSEQKFADIIGSAQHRMASRLDDLGIGRQISIQPLERSFFALYQDFVVDGQVIREINLKNAQYIASKGV